MVDAKLMRGGNDKVLVLNQFGIEEGKRLASNIISIVKTKA